MVEESRNSDRHAEYLEDIPLVERVTVVPLGGTTPKLLLIKRIEAYTFDVYTHGVLKFRGVIRSFRDKDTARLAEGERVRRFLPFERVARRRLSQLNNARSLQDLKGVGASLEALHDDRKGQHSIRISGAWRICFVWNAGHAERVEIVNYH